MYCRRFSHTIAISSNVTNKSGPKLGDFVGQTRDCGSHQRGGPRAVQASGLPANLAASTYQVHICVARGRHSPRLQEPRVWAQPAAEKDGQPQEPPRWSPNTSDGSWVGFEKKPFKRKRIDFMVRRFGRIAGNREFSRPLSPLILSPCESWNSDLGRGLRLGSRDVGERNQRKLFGGWGASRRCCQSPRNGWSVPIARPLLNYEA